MTGKRFTLGYEDDFLRWIRDNPNQKNYVVKIGFGEEDNLQDVCDLLNQLNDENEQLKNEVYDWKVSAEDQLKLGKSLKEENEQLKQQLFETSKELLWATSDEVDRALHYEDEVKELRKEIFE